MIEPRQQIKDFTISMEYVLAQNDYRGGWEGEDYSCLMNRVAANLKEMRRLFWKGARTPDRQGTLMKKATDIANFAMMIYDNAGNARNL